jgi:hypothetical protein
MLKLIVFLVMLYLTYRAIRWVLKEQYFRGDEFLAHKTEIAAFVEEHNEVTRYTEDIRLRGMFELGVSNTSKQAGLASFENTSNWNYRRDRNEVSAPAPNVYTCSLQIVRSASNEPLKYVMKYFNIAADEHTLASAEALGESITRLEEAVGNLKGREEAVTQQVSPPRFIQKHYHDEFLTRVGVHLMPVVVPYPVYKFEYVSAGGNSSQRTTLTLDRPTIDVLIETLGNKIRFARTVAGQRKLMTQKLRDAVKERDGYTCQQCSVSLAQQSHLLLEVDHIVPVSKGGLTEMKNLQTLCWRCNRSKSNKM